MHSSAISDLATPFYLVNVSEGDVTPDIGVLLAPNFTNGVCFRRGPYS